MQIQEQKLFEKHAELCSMMANPTRLAIFHMIEDKEFTVSEIAHQLNSSITKISQHLRLLRDKDLVTTRRDGREIYYRLVDARIIDAYRIIREVLIGRLKEQGALADQAAEIKTHKS